MIDDNFMEALDLMIKMVKAVADDDSDIKAHVIERVIEFCGDWDSDAWHDLDHSERMGMISNYIKA